MIKEAMRVLLGAWLSWAVLGFAAALAHGAIGSGAGGAEIRDLSVREQGGMVQVRVSLSEALRHPPAGFSIAEPARLAFDFPATRNALGHAQRDFGQGQLRSVRLVEAGDRTRVVFNLARMVPYETRLEGKDVVIALSPPAQADASRVHQALANFAASDASATAVKSVRDIQFRRGQDGEGRVVVSLSNPDTGIDVRREGSNLVVNFRGASLPEHLQRRSDVTDFGTPVTAMAAQPQGADTRLMVTPHGMWEHNAYQTDSQFVLEVRHVAEDPSRLVQGSRSGEYAGERLSLNFQDVNIRSVLQVIADFTDFNIVTSDSVQGNLTLRLQDVPWDQALDIILQAKGLDKRKTGNVIWIAPSDELAARERMQLESLAHIGDLEPLRTESFQINYHRAGEIFEFLRSREQTVLSQRGSVVFDERSNKLFVTDVASRLDEIRHLVTEIDVAPRQVLIEARVVEANKDFARDLGVRMRFGDTRASTGESNLSRSGRLRPGRFENGQLTGVGVSSGILPQSSSLALNLSLFNSAATRFLSLELAALETDNRGRVVSSPRVLTANQVEATIEQGTEIPYRKETSSGATSVEFKKAVLLLRVRPQITPDGRIQLQVQVNKDRPLFIGDFTEPAIDTKNVQTEVLVENGGTVVIGGIYEEEESTNVSRVPVLGEVPVLGGLFRNTQNISERKELLVFITPRIVSESLTLR